MSGDTPTRIVDEQGGEPRDPDDSLVGTRLGRWTLTRLIGRGGMGRVYEARGGVMNRRVALKVLNEELAADASFVKRFLREAKLLSSLSHPHVVDVIDRGDDQGRLWFAMDYVRGESLRRVMDRGPVDADKAARIASEIAGALSYAHDKDIIHRDLKPENVLLDERGAVHLVDFGLSRLVNVDPAHASTRLTRTDVILGTYEYMSPEQRRGQRELDGRADVFALGVILYEMLTGTLPLGRFTPPSRVARVPKAFDTVINRALATDREDRYRDAGEFERAIGNALRDIPEPAGEGADSEIEPVLPSHDLDEARSIMRHMEIIGALDRVLGLFLLLAALGIVSMGWLVQPIGWIVPFGGIIAFILGLYLLGLGKRIQRLESGARESQVTAAVVMLFIPPFATALGIYALIVMTSDRARKAFKLGLKAIEGRADKVIVPSRVVQLSAPSHPKPASFFMRAFTLLAICWSLYAGFLGLELLAADAKDGPLHFAAQEDAYAWTAIAAVFSLLVLIRMFLIRKQRRGFGLALIAFLFLWGTTSFLSTALDDVKPGGSWRIGADHRHRPWTHVREFPRSSRWEIPK